VAQVVEHLPAKCKTLSLNPNTTKKINKYIKTNRLKVKKTQVTSVYDALSPLVHNSPLKKKFFKKKKKKKKVKGLKKTR
jgi:hypothetical protein